MWSIYLIFLEVGGGALDGEQFWSPDQWLGTTSRVPRTKFFSLKLNKLKAIPTVLRYVQQNIISP